MTTRTCVVALALVLAAPGGVRSARAQAPAQAGATGSGYCDFVRGVADAEAALLVYPSVFGSAGVVNAGEALVVAGCGSAGSSVRRPG